MEVTSGTLVTIDPSVEKTPLALLGPGRVWTMVSARRGEGLCTPIARRGMLRA